MILYTVISRIETRADVATLDQVCRSLERQTKPISLVVVVLCTHSDLPKAVLKQACRTIPSCFHTIKTPMDKNELSPIAMCLVAIHSLGNAFDLANLWVVPVKGLRLAPKHHETLSREIIAEEKKENGVLAVGFSSALSRDARSTQATHLSEVGTVAYQLSALTLFSKTCQKAVFSNYSHIALEAFLGQVKSNNAFTKGIRMIETPGAAAAHIQTRHRATTDETVLKVCTHVVDGLNLHLVPLGTVIDAASVVVESIELCVALHFFPGSAATLISNDHEKLHTGKLGLQRTSVEISRLTGASLGMLFTASVAYVAGVKFYCETLGMDGFDDAEFRSNLLVRYPALKDFVKNEKAVPSMPISWDD